MIEAVDNSGASDPAGDVTVLLREWREGSDEALQRMIPLVYGELRRLAGRSMSRERKDHTLQPTALVNEVYMRLVDQRSARLHDRAHFFAICAQMMRRILVNHAKKQQRLKRGGGAWMVTLEEGGVGRPDRTVDALALHLALDGLSELDERKSQLVELRFFAGLTIDETAEVLGVSPATVKRDWAIARAWLYREMSRSGD